MLGFRSLLRLSLPFPSSLSLKPQPFLSPKLKGPKPLLTFATNNNELKEKEKENENGDNWSEQRRPILSLNWNTIFDPDPDNVIALGLTGLLTWASVQVLWQLLFISLAILVAALKYSFIAALLLFILIALL